MGRLSAACGRHGLVAARTMPEGRPPTHPGHSHARSPKQGDPSFTRMPGGEPGISDDSIHQRRPHHNARITTTTPGAARSSGRRPGTVTYPTHATRARITRPPSGEREAQGWRELTSSARATTQGTCSSPTAGPGCRRRRRAGAWADPRRRGWERVSSALGGVRGGHHRSFLWLS